MKIKNQLRLFIIGIIAVPLVCATSLPVYHWLTRPERTLLNGYKQVRRLADLPVSQRDFAVLRDMLKTMPPEVELLAIANHADVLLTTMPELKGQKNIDDITLFSFI